MQRESTYFGFVKHDFKPLIPGGSKSQKLRLHPNAVRGCSALLGGYSCMYLTWAHILLLLSHSFFPPWEMQMCLGTLLAPTFYILVSVIQYAAHIFPSSLRVNGGPGYVSSVAQCRSVNFSLLVNIFTSSSSPLVFAHTRVFETSTCIYFLETPCVFTRPK